MGEVLAQLAAWVVLALVWGGLVLFTRAVWRWGRR